MDRCRAFDVRLLAEKVETPAQLLDLCDLGFDYFQGYALSRPEVVAGRALDPASLQRLELVAKLVDSECDARGVESVVAGDPAMTHRLLELAGIGAARGTRREIRTPREAIVLTGMDRMRSWAALLLLLGRGARSSEQIAIALVRARMSELLAAPRDPTAGAFAFMAGMLSAFDLLTGSSLEEVLATLPLAADVHAAAMGDDSPVGQIVVDVTDYQLGIQPVGRRTGFDEWLVYAAWV